MPDYDPEKIPVLDNVIFSGDNDSDNVKSNNRDNIVEQPLKVTAKAHPEEYSQQTTDKYAVEEIIDHNNNDEIADFESALIDYNADNTSLDAVADETLADAIPAEVESVEDNATNLHSASVATAESLEAIVSDVVRQLMPELEQQLTYRVQQALEERLPQDMLLSLASSTEKTEQH